MVLFIISLVLLLVGTILICIKIGKDRAFRTVEKFNLTTNTPEAKEAIANLNDNFHGKVKKEIEFNNDCGLFQIGLALIWLWIIIFLPAVTFTLREYYVKQYCDGKYEWMHSAYVNEKGEVRSSESKTLVRVKSIKDRKTYYLQMDELPAE